MDGIAPVIRAVPSFRVLCALPFWLRSRKKIDFPYNDFLLTVMSGLSQLERDLIS